MVVVMKKFSSRTVPFINVMTPVVKMCVVCVFLYFNKTNLTGLI